MEVEGRQIDRIEGLLVKWPLRLMMGEEGKIQMYLPDDLLSWTCDTFSSWNGARTVKKTQ